MSAKKGILTAEQEEKMLQPIDEYVGKIQKKIDELRQEGTDRVIFYQSHMKQISVDKNYNSAEKQEIKAKDSKELEKAKVIENKNKEEIAKLIADAEAYLKEHYDRDYFNPIADSCIVRKDEAKKRYEAKIEALKKEHEVEIGNLKKGNGPEVAQEIKDENYVYKNKIFDAKVTYQNELQEIKDHRHEAFVYEYHLIDLLRMSRFTFSQTREQKKENRKYTFNRKQFFLQNGLYMVIIMVFILLGIITPILKGTPLFTTVNILNILQQASPRMFLALGVAGLILLTGTDLSIGRMVGMGTVTATIVMHRGINTGGVLGHIFDLTKMPLAGRIALALILCIILSTIFTAIAGFFAARFKMHPFVATMANMLIIFGLVTYATKGVSFGGIENDIPSMVIPRIGNFPTIIIWAFAAILIVWFIWNKTTFGKNLFAVGGNPEAASVSGISVFKVTMGAFIMAGILYGFGSWLECIRMVGSGSAAYGQGWDMDAIAACVVGGVSFTGGIGKISGVVVGVLIFTGLTYSLTVLGIDTNLQFVFEGIIILAAVTLDCLKYVQKK